MLLPGFSDPVLASQAVFRAVMKAMARPGQITELGVSIAPPAPLGIAAAALALTLLDFETAVWLDPTLAVAPEVDGWLKFHTGAPRATDPAAAAFAFIAEPAAMPGFDAFGLGSVEYPDGSTTLVLEVETLTDATPSVCPAPASRDRAASPRRRCPRTSPRGWPRTARGFLAGSISC
jgi:alpha-D-ribose 1-methylphosphonate 5-triphosphate synthase subunit PhnH